MGSFKRKESKGNLFHERQKARRTVIDPQNPGWVAWEWVVLVIALWNLAALPWYFAFAPDDAVRLLGVDTALDALFLLDMLCRTRLAFPDRRGRPDADPPRDSFARRGKKEDASRSPSRARRLMAGVEGSFKRLSGVGMPPSADRSTTPKIIKRRNSIPGTVSTSSESGEGNGSAGDGTAASQEASFKQEAQDEFRMSSVADEKEQAAAAAAAAAAADDEPHFERERRTSCLLYTSPSPRDRTRSRMPSSA